MSGGRAASRENPAVRMQLAQLHHPKGVILSLTLLKYKLVANLKERPQN